MTNPLFLADFEQAIVGELIFLFGEEAKHADVKRIEIGERITLANSRGIGAEGVVVERNRDRVVVEVQAVLREEPRRRIIAVQALPKGDRGLLAVQMLTEMGVEQIVAWQSDRSITRWHGERGSRSLAKWALTARESAKQARRLRVPEVIFATNADVVEAISSCETILVAHETAETHISKAVIEGDVAIVIGPEGGISPKEISLLEAAGGQVVRIADHVLRTSTAGAVLLGQLELL